MEVKQLYCYVHVIISGVRCHFYDRVRYKLTLCERFNMATS